MKKKSTIFIKYSAIIFLSLGSAIGGILYLFYHRERDSQLLITQTNEQNQVNLQKSIISRNFQSIISDLIFLSKLNEIKFESKPEMNQIKLLGQEYLEFSKQKKIYDQIRFLNRTGMETVRVNFNQGSPTIVPEAQLQLKASRYYFKESINLAKEKVYFSPFDLNIENGEIEQPLKPMIRLATPVFNNSGEKTGLVILNYLGEQLLQDISHSNFTTFGEVMLLNSDGYWLKSPNSEDEWGFMFPEKQDRTFGHQFPDAWQQIKTLDSGQFNTSQGLFTFATLYPILDYSQYNQIDPDFLEIKNHLPLKSYHWKIVSHIDPQVLNAKSATLASQMLRLYSGLLILIAIGSGWTARVIVQRHQAQAELKQSEESLRAAYLKDRLKSYVSNQIRNSLELSQILATSVEQIRELLQIDRCTFSWYRPHIDPPSWDAIQEAKTDKVNTVLGLYPTTVMGTLGEKLLSLETIQVDDVDILQDPVGKKWLQRMDFSSVLMLPMPTRSHKLGLLTCGRCGVARRWSDEDVKLLAGVVEQLAIALDQAELYQESRVNASIAQTRSEQLQENFKKLQAIQTQLIQTEKMSGLGQMIAGLAHEINNPVGFISGNLTHADEYIGQLFQMISLYQKHYPSPVADIENYSEEIHWKFLQRDLLKMLASMKAGADRIRDIVVSLRNFSRLDEAEMKPVDLHQGIESTLLMLKNRLGDRQGDRPPINLVKQYGNISEVKCYASQINQVFMNIINNAIDALEAHSKSASNQDETPSMTITISTAQTSPDFVTITIADTGPGIPDRARERIFDPFFTTKPVGQGTGLGLSISYDIIVQKHGGSLDCVSPPGKGTKFIINLPLHPTPKSSGDTSRGNPSKSAKAPIFLTEK